MYGTFLLKIMLCLREEVRVNGEEKKKKLRPFRTLSASLTDEGFLRKGIYLMR